MSGSEGKTVKKNANSVDTLALSLLIMILFSVFNQEAFGQSLDLDGMSGETSKQSPTLLLGSELRPPSITSTGDVLSSSGSNVNLYLNPYDQDEPSIAVNPTNPLNLAAGSHDESIAKPVGTTLWIITYRSLDGGATWSRSYVPRSGPIALFTSAKDPVVDFDGFGRAFSAGIASMRGGTYDDSVWAARSVDGGLNYDTPVMVDEGNRSPGTPFFEYNNRPWIGADKRTTGEGAGYVYVTWTNLVDVDGDGVEDTYHILFSRSTDGAATFSAPIQVSDAENWANQFSQVAVGPDGEVYVSWINGNSPTTRILFDKSTDYGATFGTDMEVQSFNQIPNLQYISRTPPSISMAVDTSGDAYNGYIYIAYPVDPPSATDSSDIMFTRSTTGGNTWSAPIRLNDDSTNDQFFPAVAVDPLGSFNAAWYDRRLDPGNWYIDVFQTESNDGGSSFTANTRITDTSFDPAGAFIGDHIDIDASSTQAHPIWTDRRNGNNDVYTDYAPQGHELSVSLEAPLILEPGDSTLLNATTYNVGSINETNIEIRLLINGTVVSSTVIPELLTGSSHTVNQPWTPTIEGFYNITAYAPPVPAEVFILNNNASKNAQVRVLPDILIVADDDASNQIHGTSLQEFESALATVSHDYWIWKESTMGHPSLEFLLYFKLVIWTAGDYWSWAVDPTDAATLEAYFNQGGNILLEGEDIGYDHGSDSLMVSVAHATYQIDGTEALGLQVTDSVHPVTQGLPQSFTWLTEPPADDGVTPANGGSEVIRYTGTTWTAVTVYDGIGTGKGSVVYYSFPIYSLGQPERDTLIINSVDWLFPHVHDVAVTNVIPSEALVVQGYNVSFNLTVENQGNLTETFDVTAFANSTIIQTRQTTLAQGTSTSIILVWNTTGFAKGDYTISAEATPIPGEIDTADNLYVDGVVTIVEHHDIAIINLTASPSEGLPNQLISLNVTVENQGDYSKTFNISVYYTRIADPLIGTQLVADLLPSEKRTLTFEWTSNETGRYEILANTTKIPEDVEPNDNTRTTVVYIGYYGSSLGSHDNQSLISLNMLGFLFAMLASVMVLAFQKSEKMSLFDMPTTVLKQNLQHNSPNNITNIWQDRVRRQTT